MNEKVLLVDDEEAIVRLLEVYLKQEGYQVFTAFDAAGALDVLAREEVHLAILDVMLPDMDGFTLCSRIRGEYLFPIILLTAKTADMDKINGLSLGADDYITKPFNPLEVVARVKTQLRRYMRYNAAGGAESPASDEIEIRGLTISKESHKCTLNTEEIPLTPLEFNILWFLAENRGRVISSEELFESVWGEQYLDSNNTVMTHIARLREKLHEPARKPRYVKTVWGVGYTIE